jgi:hypothetical protein
MAGALAVVVVLGSRGLTGKRFIPKVVWNSSLKWYFLYGALAMASAVYSVRPLYTIFFAAKILIALLIAAFLTDRTDLSAPMPLVMRLFFVVSIGECLLNLTFLAIDRALVGSEVPLIGYRLAGGMLEDYGTPAAMSGLYFLSSAVFTSDRVIRFVHGALYLVTWVFLGLGRTRSSIIGGMVVMVLILVLCRKPSTRVLTFIVIGLVCMTLVVTQLTDPIITFGLRGQNVNSLLTLSGRTNAFAFLLEQWKQSPLLGIGYGAGSRFLLMRFVAQSGLGIGAAHDALSKVLVELGLVGTVLITVIVAVIWREMFQLIHIVRGHSELRPVAARLFAMLAYFTLTSIVSAGISEVQSAFLVVAICVAVVQHRARIIVASGDRVIKSDGVILSPCPAA